METAVLNLCQGYYRKLTQLRSELFPILAMWNADMMAGASVAILDYEATLKMKAIY